MSPNVVEATTRLSSKRPLQCTILWVAWQLMSRANLRLC